MTLIEYVENVIGIELLDIQKKYLEELYEKYKRGEPLIVSYPKGHGAIYVNGLRTVAGVYFDRFERSEENE